MQGKPCHPHPSLLPSPDGLFPEAWSFIILERRPCTMETSPTCQGHSCILFQRADWAKGQKRDWHLCAAPTGLPSFSLLTCSAPVPGTAHPGPVMRSEKPPFVTPQLSGGSDEVTTGGASSLPSGPHGTMMHVSLGREQGQSQKEGDRGWAGFDWREGDMKTGSGQIERLNPGPHGGNCGSPALGTWA